MSETSGAVLKCQWNRRGRRTRGGRGQEMIVRVLELLSSSVSTATLTPNTPTLPLTAVVFTETQVFLRTVMKKQTTKHAQIRLRSPWKPPGQESSHQSRQPQKRRGGSETCSLSCVATAAWLSERHVKEIFFFSDKQLQCCKLSGCRVAFYFCYDR